jgi:7,8-dihydro-6-hydroxymethylpterin-pyrophosphokinase
MNICSNQANDKWKDRIIDVDQIVVHNNVDSTIEISSTLDGNANQKSWGFR